MDSDDHDQLLADCEAREARLTDWERGFIDSLQRQRAEGRSLTAKQSETLDTIWERVTARG